MFKIKFSQQFFIHSDGLFPALVATDSHLSISLCIAFESSSLTPSSFTHSIHGSPLWSSSSPPAWQFQQHTSAGRVTISHVDKSKTFLPGLFGFKHLTPFFTLIHFSLTTSFGCHVFQKHFNRSWVLSVGEHFQPS